MKNNQPKDLYPGALLESNNFGTVRIDKYENSKSVSVTFLKTGFSSKVRADHLRSGKVKDASITPKGRPERDPNKRNEVKFELSKRNFLKEVEGSGYSLLGVYTGNKVKVDMICDKNHKVSISPSNFKKGKRCFMCQKHGILYGSESFYKICKDNGYTNIGEYNGGSSLVKMTCPNGHDIKKRPRNMTKTPTCQVCNGIDRNTVIYKFKERLSERGWYLNGEYKNKDTPVDVICDKGHHINIMPGNFNRGQGCGVCRGFNQHYLYANLVSDGAANVCIKFGIASNPSLRIKIQNNNNKKYDIKNIALWKFDSVSDCRACETEIKRSFNCGFLSKEDLPDGFSETTSINNIDEIFSFIDSQGGNRVG